MGFWETLAGILPDSLIHIERDETNVTLVQSGEGHQLTAVNDGEDGTQVLQVDMESLSEQERAEVVAATWDDQGELFVEESQREKEAIEGAAEDTEIQRTLDFFRPYLNDPHFEMLRAALYLRDTWRSDDYHLEPHELRKRKRDIAERYGEGAEVVCNLSTANYFDEGGYVRQLFEDYEPTSSDPTHQELFEEIIANQPFTVFVGANDSVPWIIGSVKEKIEQKKQYRVEYEFIDVRGIGKPNREKIRQAIENLAAEADQFRHEQISERPDMVERIYLTGVSGLVDS